MEPESWLSFMPLYNKIIFIKNQELQFSQLIQISQRIWNETRESVGVQVPVVLERAQTHQELQFSQLCQISQRRGNGTRKLVVCQVPEYKTNTKNDKNYNVFSKGRLPKEEGIEPES